jgi:hypothetical protein
LTFFRAKIGRKKRIRTVRTAEQKEFESEVSLEKMYGLHNEFAFLVVTKKANFLSQVRFLFGLQFLLKKVNCSLLVGPFFGIQFVGQNIILISIAWKIPRINRCGGQRTCCADC